MEQVAAAADVARATLYNHFPVKEALLDHYFRGEFEAGVGELMKGISAGAALEEQLVALFDAFSVWAAKRRAYLPYCLDYGLKAGTGGDREGRRSQLRPLFASLLGRAQQSGELAAEADAQGLAHYLEHLYFAATLRWLSGDEASPAAECRRMLALFLRGVARPPQRSKGRPR